MERFPPNKQVTVAQISSSLCFECGDLFKNRKDYEQHVLNHQSILFYNVLYHEEQRESREKKRFGVKHRSPKEFTSPESISSRRHTVPSVVSSEKFPCASNGKLTLLADDECVTPNQASVLRHNEKERIPVGSSGVSVYEQSSSHITEDVSNQDGPQTPAFEEVPMNHGCPFNCGYSARNFTHLIRHCCICHKSLIASCEYRFEKDDVTLFSKSDSNPGTDCGNCLIPFETATEYYLHLLEQHLDVILGIYYSKKKSKANRVMVRVILEETSDCPQFLEACIKIVKEGC